MKRFITTALAALLALALFLLPACSPEEKQAISTTDLPKVKNVIFMIGDGMGFNQVKLGSYYQTGKAEGQVFHKFPVKLAASTYFANHEYNPEKDHTYEHLVHYVPTDSAAAGSALSTGRKYNRGTLAMDENGPVQNVAERAEELGLSTGVVTTVTFPHATPAAFSAHNVLRSNYSEIANEQINDSALEVIMGCGHPLYNNNGEPMEEPDYEAVGGQKTWEALTSGQAGGDCDGDGKADKWTYIEKAEDFRKLMEGDTPKRVFGVPMIRKTIQAYRKSHDDNNKDDEPFETPLLENMPTLAEMSLAALNVLDNNEKGFFLMIEGGAIDWACHGNAAGRLIEEEVAFAEAIDAVVNWVEKNSSWEETIVIITADHETGLLLGAGSNPDIKEIQPFEKGTMPEVHWGSLDHSNQLVPVFAKGALAEKLLDYADEEDPVRGKYMDNTEIAKFIFSLYGKEK